MYREFDLHEVSFILFALRWTLLLTAVAFCGGAVLGLAIAFMRLSRVRIIRAIALIYIRVNQGVPLLTQLFLVFFGISMLGLEVSAFTAAAICFVLNASAFLGETWRGCIQSIPQGQVEAGYALGLGKIDINRFVVIPQAARIASGPTVGCLVYIVKGTSLSSLIGFVELTRAGQIVNNATMAPFMVFGIVGGLYFLLCWPLSLLAGRLERASS
ncbi:amino acid ABC transporter permease [Microvirga sp. M2]|uniref:amino acid ABC transporter permease n=1 Tax=Microvirga sp. M2 TaxID=3073270 RepID=UPI0039C145EC